MGIIYPDNQNRVNRVQQLATNISQLQSNIQQYVDGIHMQDNRTLPMLDRISERAGFPTLEAFLKDARNQMTPEQREKYEEMKTGLEGRDSYVDVALKVGNGVFAIGVAVKFGGPLMIKLFTSTLMQLCFVAIARGTILVISGSVDQGVHLIRAGARGVRYVSDVSKVGETVSKALRYVKIASKVLLAVGLLIDGVLLVWELIEGKEQKEKLQAAIVELVSRRFTVKMLERSAWVSQLMASDAKSLVELQDDLDQDIQDGEITKEKAQKKMEKKAQRVIDQLQESMAEHVTGEIVWQALSDQDRMSGVAWTEDDPGMQSVQKWLEEHEGED
ncbi:hypothetical protein B0H14DRAFT_2675416 [Mycena olivaceomarginata]|nr:hypothetical protein B0H14DRAFT_2675416 [Mycena olivaceomarginata]